MTEKLASYRSIVNADTAEFVPYGLQGTEQSDLTWCNISYDDETGQGSFLIRFKPGSSSINHEHIGYEEFLVLDGEVEDSDGMVYRKNDFVSLKPGYEASDEVEERVKSATAQIIGPIARPSHVWVTSDLPKTRSGKIMRRVIAAISNFIDVGDTTTLANPEVVEEIRVQVQSAKVAAGQVPKGVPQSVIDEIKRFGEEG